jgi:hypothetical protein
LYSFLFHILQYNSRLVMASPLANDPERVASIMLSWHSLDLVSCNKLQTLWAGYGTICAITARATTNEAAEHLSKLCGVETQAAGTTYPLILKLISPPSKGANQADEGHLRKMLSYEVEQTFYSDVVPLLGDEIAVAQCLASTRQMKGEKGEAELDGLLATIMVDLSPRFPVSGGKRSALDRTQVHSALEWLARFHARSWGLLPDSLGLMEGTRILPHDGASMLLSLEIHTRNGPIQCVRRGEVALCRSPRWLHGS